jgi:hypothetical protein
MNEIDSYCAGVSVGRDFTDQTYKHHSLIAALCRYYRDVINKEAHCFTIIENFHLEFGLSKNLLKPLFRRRLDAARPAVAGEHLPAKAYTSRSACQHRNG